LAIPTTISFSKAIHVLIDGQLVTIIAREAKNLGHPLDSVPFDADQGTGEVQVESRDTTSSIRFGLDREFSFHILILYLFVDTLFSELSTSYLILGPSHHASITGANARDGSST